MKFVRTILYVQLALGLVGGFWAFGDIHMSAMGRARSHGMRAEYERIRQSPDFREPPPIQGYTLARLVDAMEADARRRGEIAFRAFIGSLAASLFAATMLFFLGRARYAQKIAQQAGCSEPRDSDAGSIRTSVARGR